MPYSDREKQLAYLRDYSRRYAEEHAEDIRRRRADWFQARKAAATVLQRVKRTLARCEPGLARLEGSERESARAAIAAVAAAPDLPLAAQAGLWVAVSIEGRRRFLDGLESVRERRRWAMVLDLPAEK